MKKTNIFLMVITIFSVLLFAFACNMLKKENTAVNNTATENKTTDNKATENKTSNTASTNSSNNTTVPSAPKDVSGRYTVEGTNEGGAGKYEGDLTVTKRGEVYQFSWNTAGKLFDGVGIQTSNSVAVAFAEGKTGEGCGVALYKINSDGSLEGKAGYWGENNLETEKATRTSGTDLVGEYDLKGKNLDGKDYTGKLTVKAEGSGFTFNWTSEGRTFKGFGIKQGDKVVTGIGGEKCGFVSYEVAADGTMNGKWGGYGTTSVGTETAKKK